MKMFDMGQPAQVHTNGKNEKAKPDLPPSSIAAQLTKDVSYGPSGSQIDAASFEQLLLEILGDEKNLSKAELNIENDLEANRDLILVLVKAGLSPLRDEDPFTRSHVHIDRARKSATVIRLVLLRNYGVLSSDIGGEVESRSPQDVPFYCWLLPRLFEVLGKTNNQELFRYLVQLLRVISWTSIANSRHANLGKQLHACLEKCAESALSYTESRIEGQNQGFLEHSFTLQFGPSHDRSVGIPESNGKMPTYELTLDQPQQTAVVAIALFQAFSPYVQEEVWPQVSLAIQSSSWILDRLLPLWRKLSSSSEVLSNYHYSTNRLLETLSMLLNCVDFITSLPAFSQKALFCLYEVVSYLVSPVHMNETHIELEILQSCLSMSMKYLQKSVVARALAAQLLEPVILSYIDDQRRLHSAPPRVQVFLAISFAYLFPDDDVPDGLLSALKRFQDEAWFSKYELHLTLDLRQSLSSSKTSLSKRRKLSDQSESQRHYASLVGIVYRLLGSQEASDLDGLSRLAPDAFTKLSDGERSEALEALAKVPCAGTGSSRLSIQSWSGKAFECEACDSPDGWSAKRKVWSERQSKEIFKTLSSLLPLPEFQRSTTIRVQGMLAVKKAMLHTDDSSQLLISESPLGQWCLQCLRSSLRELRIAAAKTLPSFLITGFDELALKRNWIDSLSFLNRLSATAIVAFQETCSIAWFQIAPISSNDELSIIIVHFVQYLGQSNAMISGQAFTNLKKLCESRNSTPQQLLSPCWRSVVITVVRDIQSRPQSIQLLADLLEVSVQELLVKTQVETLPYLVLTHQKAILERIANARGHGSTIWSTCFEKANMAAILALLFVQPSTDVESLAMTLLCDASEDFRNLDLVELARSDPILIACELLKLAADEESVKSSKPLQGVHLLSSLLNRRGQTRAQSSKGALVQHFLEAHVLGIMAQFSNSINDGSSNLQEKKRSLKAIQEMCRLAGDLVGTALPQIIACLQSSIEVEGLREQAFITWSSLLRAVGDKELHSVLESTFSVAVYFWDSSSPTAQELMRTMIVDVFDARVSLNSETSIALPSLSSIDAFATIESKVEKLRCEVLVPQRLSAFVQRCKHDNAFVVHQALAELVLFLGDHQTWIHNSVITGQINPVIAELLRTLLDACVRFGEDAAEVPSLSARCIGLVGCLDSNRVESVREKQTFINYSDFEDAKEVKDWVMFFLGDVLVKAFLAATNTRVQGFLAYAMQEFLRFCGIVAEQSSSGPDIFGVDGFDRWQRLPESTRSTLAPFINSKYVLSSKPIRPASSYPIFTRHTNHASFLREFSLDLMERARGENAQNVFHLCSRIIRGQDLSIAAFLLPYVALNVVVGESDHDRQCVGSELLSILEYDTNQSKSSSSEEMIKLCSETVFQILEYFTKWLQGHKKDRVRLRSNHARSSGVRSWEDEEGSDQHAMLRVEQILKMIPSEVISRRAMTCRSYSRALFYWEQHIRQSREQARRQHITVNEQPLFESLQDIYTQIDEPDGIEGISAHLQILDLDKQILEHRKAGRWTAVQSWCELLLTQRPFDVDIQVSMLSCLKESGQFEFVLNQVSSMSKKTLCEPRLLPFAIEAAWVTSRWDVLQRYVDMQPDTDDDFIVAVGQAINHLSRNDDAQFEAIIRRSRARVAKGLSLSSTSSLQACRDDLLKLHALYEMSMLRGYSRHSEKTSKKELIDLLNHRLEVLGAFASDKQFLLGLRRAVMQLSRNSYTNYDLAHSWLNTARLARKGNFTHQSYGAVMHASQYSKDSAAIEQSRLLWIQGYHRKAIQSLEGAISADVFSAQNLENESITDAKDFLATSKDREQNLLLAHAQLLLTKWLDKAGQSQSHLITMRYRKAANTFIKWEKGHYYLGRHYNKLLKSEEALPPPKQAFPFINGETAKLVIESYLRALCYGTKYLYQTIPRILTLWLDLGASTDKPIGSQFGSGEEFKQRVSQQRRAMLNTVHAQLKKYMDRLPAYIFYTALQQMVARITHSNVSVFEVLQRMIVKVVSAHPQQALWTLLAVAKSSSRNRAHRGLLCLDRVKESSGISGGTYNPSKLRGLVNEGQRLSDQLLSVCDFTIPGKPSVVSLTRDLLFKTKTVPCDLAVPLEKTLTAALPTMPYSVRKHQAFDMQTVTIEGFLDEVLVLHSLQRPRKISVRGSDGQMYGLLCKPKDDLRKDQRLMEFNSMINRSLAKDEASSKRRLYIKTYAVTPLNEECGLIEWVDNLKTLRDILLKLYKSKGVNPNYGEIRLLLDEASSDSSKLSLFTEKILPSFPPVFHEWFMEHFPDPGSWFNARLRYTRSCAVMSMVGMTLGLGDRHGENILFEESTGGTFHVDFNCLFDKGLTFDKPELVPFRLTHNMVDAFGVYGYEGPFRKSCELTLKILRQHEDTLLTILETFVYDPTTDFIGKKKRAHAGVPGTPQEVLDSVQSKVRGLLRGESVPLSVEGHVQELIQQATDPANLAAMYIGWCAFF